MVDFVFSSLKPVFSRLTLFAFIMCFSAMTLNAQSRRYNIKFVISMPDPAGHLYHVHLTWQGKSKPEMDFHMCAWTPGFYELLDFSSAVSNFTVRDINGIFVSWKKTDTNTWHVRNMRKQKLFIDYDIKAVVPFIGNVYLDENYGYMIPGGVLMYLKSELRHPLSLQIKPFSKWPGYVATGLNAVPGRKNTFYAANFDELYDSPVLMGKLEQLSPFYLNGIKHEFVAFNLGNFNRQDFINDLKKIAKSTIRIFGTIPFKHYTFLAIGMNNGGFGGIEHLNSTSLMLGNKGLLSPGRKETFYEFLAHEYFHLFNAKRIRPIELGPFDYSKENKTDLLWVTEGFTDYYQYLIVHNAGLIDDDKVLEGYREHIINYENTPGHLYQNLVESSREIWTVRGAPTTRNNDELNKTISVYDKGCALALMLDLKIRHQTQNHFSLDDVMRALYHDFYLVKKRGFTDSEFKRTCERIAGTNLSDLFEYATTVKPVDYPRYFAYAGLAIDTTTHHLHGDNLGITAATKDSSVLIKAIAWNSPAWHAGLQQNDQLIKINDTNSTLQQFNTPLSGVHDGDAVTITIIRAGITRLIKVNLTPWDTKLFNITRVRHPTHLQVQLYNSWMKHKNKE